MRCFADQKEAFNCNILQFALLRRSLSAVKKIINERPGLVAERNALDQNSLHLAFDWPEATKRLLSNGNAATHCLDVADLSPIAYAVMIKDVETVKILLANGCPLQLMYESSFNKPRSFELCDRYFCLDIFEAVASTLVQRRLELMRSARQLLPERLLGEIVPRNEIIPDASCIRLINALLVAVRDRTGLIPECNKYSIYCDGLIKDKGAYESVHHTWTGPAEGAETLFNAGFSSITGKDEHGRNPLQSPWHFGDVRSVAWFYKKGCPLAEIEDFTTSANIPNTNPNVHWLLRKAWSEISRAIQPRLYIHYAGGRYGYDDDLNKALRIILEEELAHCVDGCQCPCSLAGCDPVTIILKLMASGVDGRAITHHSAEPLKFAQCLLVTLEDAPNWNKAGQISRSFIRFTLYEILGLQHTCCITDHRPFFHRMEDFKPRFSAEEFDEITEENSTSTEKFETLLLLAQSEWEHTSKPWTRFWRDFYLDHIAIDLDDQDDTDEDYLKTVTKLGIRVERERESGHQCSWLCYFEQPVNGDESIEEKQEGLADMSPLDNSGAERSESSRIKDSVMPRAKTSADFVCPFYEQHEKEGKIIPF